MSQFSPSACGAEPKATPNRGPMRLSGQGIKRCQWGPIHLLELPGDVDMESGRKKNPELSPLSYQICPIRPADPNKSVCPTRPTTWIKEF